jgi:hypothetical protein
MTRDEEKAAQLLERCEDEVEFRNRDGAIALIVEAIALARNAGLEEAAKVTDDASIAARKVRRYEVAKEMDIATLRIRELKADES